MKGLVFTCLSLASLALGAPSLKRQDGVTAEQLNNFKLYAQWSAAAACNNEKSPGEPVTCNLNQCSMFASHNATVAASFIGTVLDTRGFVGIDPVDELIVVSFRGSQSIRNWIADFIFIQVPCDFTALCLVHTGFQASWAEVSSRALAAVAAAKAANPSYKVVATGYSLGAAIATLAAVNLREAGHQVDLYTYGSPRVGNRAFVEFVTQQTGGEYRITHRDDPVPRLPPIVLNYRHTSPEYWIDPGTDSIVTLDEVDVCPGYSNVNCNGGTLGLNIDAHGYYFQSLSGCSPETIPFKSRASDISDEELEAKLNMYVKMDIQAAQNLHAEGQS